MSFKQIKALSFLGTFFTLHFIKKILRINQRGKKEFIEDYAQDRIFPISAELRSKMPVFSKCLNCRICDTVCPKVLEKPEQPAPSYIVGTFSRSLTDFDLFDDAFECGDCMACEQACPHHVPIKEVIGFVKDGKKEIIKNEELIINNWREILYSSFFIINF